MSSLVALFSRKKNLFKMFDLVVSSIQLVFVSVVVFILILFKKIHHMMHRLSAVTSNNNNNNNNNVGVQKKNEVISPSNTFKDLGPGRGPYKQYRDRTSDVLRNTLLECEKLMNTTDKNKLINNANGSKNFEVASIKYALNKIRPIIKPIMKFSCVNCTPMSRENFSIKNGEVIVNNMLKPRLEFYGDDRFIPRKFNCLYQIYKLEKFKFIHIDEKILKNNKIQESIEKSTLQELYDGNGRNFTDTNYLKLLKMTQNRANTILNLMKSKMSDFLLRFVSWILYKLLPCFLTDVRIKPEQIELLKKAGATQTPIIFLPVHKSHLDYILISFILLNNNIRPPLVASGDNLRLPFFGSLLRGLGAFFIKRRNNQTGSKDYVYKAVLQVYIDECLKSGHNIEFYLEGGRTRTGKTCMPKYGILSIIVDACVSGVIDDAYLVPIGINYEKLVDGNFVRELLGQPKQMETFWSALKGIWSVVNSNYGSVQIDFSQPFSLRELIRTFQKSNNSVITKNGVSKTIRPNVSITSIYGTDIIREELRQIVENISRHILSDCTDATAIMSSNAVAFLLLTRYRDGTTKLKLLEGLRRLVFDLKWDEQNIGFEFVEDYDQMVDFVCKLLGPNLIEVTVAENNEQFLRPVLSLESLIELSYYGNIVVHSYALQSILANVILNSKSDNLNENEIIDDCLELCDVLQYEFVFCKPCQDLTSIFSLTLETMIVTDEVLYVEPSKLREDNEIDDDGIELLPKRYQKDRFFDQTNRLKYLKSILEPLIFTYIEVSESLMELVDRPLFEKDFNANLLEKLKNKWKEGSLKYAESISLETIKNALKLFQKWSIIDFQTRDDLPTILIIENVENLNNMLAKINKFR